MTVAVVNRWKTLVKDQKAKEQELQSAQSVNAIYNDRLDPEKLKNMQKILPLKRQHDLGGAGENEDLKRRKYQENQKELQDLLYSQTDKKPEQGRAFPSG